MTRRIARGVISLSILLLVACGNESFLLPSHKDAADFELKSASDGLVLLPGDSIPVSIAASDSQKNKDLELLAVLYSSSNAKAWETRLTSPALNEPLSPLKPTGLAPGQYRLELTLLSAGDELSKKTVHIFFSSSKMGIMAIKSFPAVITPSSVVFLKSELSKGADANPYLRWKWRSQVIAAGSFNQGYAEILWTAPSEEGVYTISLEIFPTAPTAEAASVKSSLSLSTDIYVSAATKAAAGNLGPQESYYALYQLQANLKDTGTAVKKSESTEGTLIGSPRVVPTQDAFGYRLSAGDGIRFPWIVLPLGAGDSAPFTVSIGLRLEAEADSARVLTVSSADGESTFVISIEKGSPVLAVSAGGQEKRIPSSAKMEKDQRHMISVSLTPRMGEWTVQWFKDGVQTDVARSSLSLSGFKAGGSSTIGGVSGFTGTVDCFGVYCRDPKGTPAPDPSLYARAARQEYKEALVLAEGFDGISIPEGFVTDKGAIEEGLLSLPPGSALSLPAFTMGSEGVEADFTVSTGSSVAAVLSVSRQGGDSPLATVPLAVQNAALHFTLKDGALYYGPDTKKSVKLAFSEEKDSLIFTIQPAEDSPSPLVLDRILVIKEKG